MKKLLALCLALVPAFALMAEDEASAPDQLATLTAELKNLKAEISTTKKSIQAKKSEAGKITRTIKGAYLLGDMSQMGLIARRRPTKEEKRFYPPGDLFLVKPVCICKHHSAEDGGTTSEHFEFSGSSSFGNVYANANNSRGSKSKQKACPQYLAWRKAMDDVDKTNAMKTKIEPVIAEWDKLEEQMSDLEQKKKDLELKIKEEKKRKAAEKAAQASSES